MIHFVPKEVFIAYRKKDGVCVGKFLSLAEIDRVLDAKDSYMATKRKVARAAGTDPGSFDMNTAYEIRVVGFEPGTHVKSSVWEKAYPYRKEDYDQFITACTVRRTTRGATYSVTKDDGTVLLEGNQKEVAAFVGINVSYFSKRMKKAEEEGEMEHESYRIKKV